MSQGANRFQKLTRRIERLLPSRKGNLKVVILCIIAATTFWFFSALNKSNYTTRIRYPIEFNYFQDSNIYLLSELPEDITVQVYGGGWDLLKKSLRVNTPAVEINLDTPTQTKYILGQSLAEQVSDQLDNLRLEYVVTDTLRINIDSLKVKSVAVALDTRSLQLAENYRLASEILISPPQIELEGPASLLQQTSDTIRVQLEEENIEGELETTLSIPVPDERLTAYPDEVMINLNAKLYTRVERKTPVVPLNFPEDSSLFLAQNAVTVSFWLPDDFVSSALNRLSFRVEADLQTMNSKDSTITAKLVNFPAVANDISLNPTEIRVNNAP